MNDMMRNSDDELFPFSPDDLTNALKHVKNGKVSGLDGVSAKMINHFGPQILEWLRTLFNSCALSKKLPRIWRKAKVVALLKPEKDPYLPESYRPISLFNASVVHSSQDIRKTRPYPYNSCHRGSTFWWASRISGWQIVLRSGFKLSPIYWGWIWGGKNHWHRLCGPLCCIWHYKPSQVNDESGEDDQQLPHSA